MNFKSLRIATAIFSLVATATVARAQNSVVNVSGDDLHYLGYVLLTGDTAAWTNIKSNDVFYLSKSLFYRKAVLLDYIQDDNLYFFGYALLTAKAGELQKITDNNWFYLGSAMFEKTIAYLENVDNDDVYYLGKAVIQRDFNFLTRLSSEKD